MTIPCTECRKRKETLKKLKEAESDNKKLRRTLAHRANKITDLEETVSTLRRHIANGRKTEKRMKSRYDTLLNERNELVAKIKLLKKNVKKAMEE